MNEIDELYQEVILDHSKNPRNKTELENFTHEAKGHNPLCGDQISIQIITIMGIKKLISKFVSRLYFFTQ